MTQEAGLTGLPNARGSIDRVVEDATYTLNGAGWILSPNGPFDSLFVATGDDVFPATQVNRPDIGRVFPWIPGAADAGFNFSISLADRSSFALSNFLEYSVIGAVGGEHKAQIKCGYYRPVRPWKTPPEHLMMRVMNTKVANNFRVAGMKTCINMLSSASRHLQLHKIRRVLDWGCGCGRLTPHLLHFLPRAEIHGTDIDAEAVAWAAQQFPNAHLRSSGPFPPLPYEDASFDLILAGSVFTHLTESDQTSWLREMRRLLSQDGVMLATTHGDFAGRFNFRDEKNQFFKSGFSDEGRDNVLKGIAPPDYYRATFQSKKYTMDAWGREFDIIDFIEAGYANYQDIFIVRKRSA